jgi:hypothetical protein
MDRNKLLLAAALVSVLATVGLSGQQALADEPVDQCSQGELRAGLCPPPGASGEFGGGGVDLEAGYEIGGGGGGGRGGGGDNGQGGDGDGVGIVYDDRGGKATGPVIGGPIAAEREGFTVSCAPQTPCDPNLVVRVSDLVNIRPASATSQMEPSGWMVVGLPANFVASASVHMRSGELLGFPADVRFTPAGFRWDYGDGSARSTGSGGATWAALGLVEFSETATSHTFQASGEYSITPSVVYTAEYQFAGQGWREVAGTLTVASARMTAVAGDAKTVLVDEDCQRNPLGPGC